MERYAYMNKHQVINPVDSCLEFTITFIFTNMFIVHLQSQNSSHYNVILLSTVGDGAFPVTAARVWNSLPDLVASAPSVAVFQSRLKTHVFNISYPSPLWLYSARTGTLGCFAHYNRSSLLKLSYIDTQGAIYGKLE